MSILKIRLPNGARLELLKSLPFFLIHLTCLAVLFIRFHWWYLPLAVGLYFGRMFWVTAGYHRYFSHRSFRTSRWFQFLLAFFAMTSLQKGVLWWAANHRHHHRYSDQEEDLHSPTRSGFWWSHVGWILADSYNYTRKELIPDLYRFAELRWLNRYHAVPGALLAVVLYLIGGWGALLWGFFVSTVLLWHGTYTVNSLAHLFGRRRYATRDTSKNSLVLALITMGEGWHNNHHHYMASVKQGFYWWEIDMTYYLLKVFSWCGLIWDLKKPPAYLLQPAGAQSSS